MSRSPWSPDLSLHGRIAVSLSAAGALLLAVVGISTGLLIHTRNVQTEVITHYYQALLTSQNYFVGMLDSETAVRGYALSRDNATLAPLNDAGQPWAHPISGQVTKLISGSTSVMNALRKVESDTAAWHDGWAAPTIERTQAGGVISSAEVERGKQLFDSFRADYTVYIDQLRKARQDRADQLVVLTNLLFDTTVIAALLALITAVILWWLLRRWVSRPVTALVRETQVVSGGNVDHRVEATGPREFLQLGEAVEAMRERLVTQIAAIETTRQQVADARAEVEQQADELQRSNRELEQFAYVASHDLQEPLRKVASFCQLLERRYAGQLDERANQYIHFAVDGARRMQQLINDLLDFSRVGRLSSSPVGEVDTGACLRAALTNVETARIETGATVDVQSAMPVVPGEAPLLTQLFQNLISNAIKFRAEEPLVIQIGAVRGGDDWEFWCADNGIGIPAEYADRVFLIFQRLHPKEVYEGTGIGLAMCRKIVEYHGGRIWVDATGSGSTSDGQDGASSGRPTGTTVRWTLPAEHGALAVAEEQPERAAAGVA